MHSINFNEKLDGSDLKIAIIRSRFNEEITQALLDGALAALSDVNVDSSDIRVFSVPGAFEISLAAKKAAQSGEFDVVICLGAVIKGDTLHFDYINQAVTAGIVQVNLETEIPVIFGVLTVNSVEQALDRVKPDKTNKGYEVALSAIEMVKTCQEIEEI
jgi:6,7-dimethyl-8-ribityllumazine synthase